MKERIGPVRKLPVLTLTRRVVAHDLLLAAKFALQHWAAWGLGRPPTPFWPSLFVREIVNHASPEELTPEVCGLELVAQYDTARLEWGPQVRQHLEEPDDADPGGEAGAGDGRSAVPVGRAG